MKFKQKSKCSSNKVNKTLLLQLFVVIGVCTLITCASGCRTGGARLNPNSAGKVVQPSPRKKLPPPKLTQPLTPAPTTPPKSTPVAPTNTVRSTPVPPKQSSAKANPVKVNPKPAGELKPFSPTISSITPKLVEDDGKRTVITDDETANIPQVIEPIVAAPLHQNPPLSQTAVNWLHLFTFYMSCFLGLIILWVIYDIVKDAIEMKRRGSPMKKHLENLKKPAKGTRAARKTIKKKPTKKK